MHKLFAVLIIFMILSVACAPVREFLATVTPAPTPLPPLDLLSDSTCAKPRVLGITPGVTAESEAWTIVQSNKFLLNCTQHDLTSQGGIRWIDCSSDSFGVNTLSIAFSHETADDIAITQRRLTVEQIIQKYGYPNLLTGLGRLLPDEPPNSKAVLAYDHIQATVTLELKPTDSYEITPDTLVDFIAFRSKEEYRDLTAHMLVHWHGYGVYGP